MRTAQLVFSLVGFVATGVGSMTAAQARVSAADTAAIAELWIEPNDVERRDLFRGPADGPHPPPEGAQLSFVKLDTTGRSRGYDARDAKGATWSVKLGPEAQSEVTASRILWAIGFHQPPTFYVRNWTLSGAPAEAQATENDAGLGGRFRPEIPGWTVIGDWQWNENPHMALQPHAGLLVAQMIVNNWDLKSSNNKIYEIANRSGAERRRYVVRDLGASLGSNEQAKWLRWTQLRMSQGTKNDLAGFLASGFIDHVRDGRVVFEYSGPNKPLVENITPADVRWTARLLSRLSDKQWQDAFRAGGYTPDDSARYIARLKERVAEGLALK